MLEKCKTCDDGLLKFVVPMILQYVEEFTQCEILSRKLVFQVSWEKLSNLIHLATIYEFFMCNFIAVRCVEEYHPSCRTIKAMRDQFHWT